ncbi:MAG: hypothetical protein IJW78_05075 [Clostridia bacterium]|nr:hypothetical protein [Clostridia bacterium]MBQ7289084.1 hypothetical protein [Clostridia bacterium]
MKRTTVGIFSFQSYLADFKRYRSLLLLLFCFIGGLLCGTLLFRNADSQISSSISDYIINHLLKRQEYSFFKIFCVSLASLMPFFLSVFVLGLSPIGPIFIPLTMLLRGSGIGLIFGYLYKNYEIKGIAFSLLILLPVFLFSSYILLLSGCDSLKFSGSMLRAFSPKAEPVSFAGNFRLYISRYIFFLFLILLCSFTDTIFSVAFIRFFEL